MLHLCMRWICSAMDDTCVCWGFIQCLMGGFLAAEIWCCIHVCAGYAQPLLKPVCVGPLLVTVLSIG